jgi:Na+-transporting NADH:ubiquinone oxidoreductase subunit NqrB
MPPPQPRPRLDPRWYQIAVLAGLLAYGMLALGFDVSPTRAGLFLGTVLATQYACTVLWRLPKYDPKSALISGLSLCLLLRTNEAWLAGVAAVFAVASKFLIRVGGKHILNPTNGALVAMLLVAGDRVWVSPGQWGNTAFFGFLMACLGGLVVNRAARSDVTLAFLVTWVALLFGRSAWLAEPIAIPLHRLESGALLLFAFFMISDPKTTPDSRAGRLLFGYLVAIGAAFVQWRLFRTNGLLWALAFWSLWVPLIDRLLPGTRYAWTRGGAPTPATETPPEGAPHGSHAHPAGAGSGARSFFPLAARRIRVLRLLRRQGRREALQPGLPGGPRP